MMSALIFLLYVFKRFIFRPRLLSSLENKKRTHLLSKFRRWFLVFNELHHHHHPWHHLHERVPHPSFSPLFPKPFHFGTLVFEVHTRIGRRRTGPGSRCSRRRRLKTTQQLWRANFTQFSPRASQLNLERRSVCKTQTSVGNVVVVTLQPFFLVKNTRPFNLKFFGALFSWR